jgi:DNA-directed RNA polymerase subunit RPC12/RpoP
VVCAGCGTVLYDGLDLRPPDEIIQEYNGKCPKCGKKLSFAPKKIDVSSA